MCWPTCKGGAYLAVSVFIYRSVLVIIAMISSSITRLKTTYVPISVIEELLLQLIYFIPLFTSSAFIFIGLEGSSFSFVFFSAISLCCTLFIRYAAEISYIYLINWDAFRLKTPSIFLNLTFDLILLIVLFLYANNRLRKLPWATSKEIYQEDRDNLYASTEYANLLVSNEPSKRGPPKDINIRNELASKGSPTGQGIVNEKGPQVLKSEPTQLSIHHPFNFQAEKERLNRPLPPDPELDDISLPPPVPLASPDYEDI